MGKRQPNTPRSQIRSALRKLWMRSRERTAALKREKYCCERCGIKQSKAKGREVKIEVHHKSPDGIMWEEIIDLIYERILVDPAGLEVCCKGCHKKIHEKDKKRIG